jgi:hypothetical protein
MSIKVLLAKLTSGEEIIARIDEEMDTYYVISKARLLMVNQQPNGQMGMGMIPWLMGAPESSIRLEKNMISGKVMGEIPKELEDSYLQQTSNIHLG